jgi:DNA polymerase-3 subunit epsilon
VTAWWEGPLVAFDLETTGPDPEDARIVTAHASLVEADGTAEDRLDLLVDPGVQIPAGATAVHGVTTERARAEGVPAADGVAMVARALGAWQDQGIPLVAFNAYYDFTVLDRECTRYGLDRFVPAVVVDPFVLDKQLDRYRKGKRTLAACCEVYGVTLDDAHEASADAIAAVHVVRAMGARAPFPPAERLHAAQIGWRAEQCAYLADYFARQGKPQDVRGEWPVLPVLETSETGATW